MKNFQYLIRNIARAACAAALLAAATGAPAQMSYRQAAMKNASTIDAREADDRLQRAQLARMRGASPLAGEQLGNQEASAVNHRYWQRQEKLRLSVERAQRRSNETRNPRLVARR